MAYFDIRLFTVGEAVRSTCGNPHENEENEENEEEEEEEEEEERFHHSPLNILMCDQCDQK